MRTTPSNLGWFGWKSFDNWSTVLTDWKVLVDGVGAEFLMLGELRNRSIHLRKRSKRN